MMKKDDFKHLQVLIIAQTTLLGALIEELGRKGLIDSKVVITNHNKELEGMVEELIKK
jgi:hypothetical protein